MLETKCVGDKFEMLVTDLIHIENQQHNEKSRQPNDSATNIWKFQTEITVTVLGLWIQIFSQANKIYLES